jgi:hypothetical protein
MGHVALSMEHGHADRHATQTYSIDMLHGYAHGHGALICMKYDYAADMQKKCRVDMEHRHAFGNVAWICSFVLHHGQSAWAKSMDIQNGIGVRTCGLDMEHGHAAWRHGRGALDMKHEHVPWTCKMDMHNGQTA